MAARGHQAKLLKVKKRSVLTDGEMVTPPGLKPSGGVRRIWELALTKNEKHSSTPFRLYVIEVGESETVKFYVGSTGKTVEERLNQHQSRDKEKMAAKIFCKKLGTALMLRYDLFKGLPHFAERDIAEKAEGILAAVIEAQLKVGVECEVLKARKTKRGRAASNSRDLMA